MLTLTPSAGQRERLSWSEQNFELRYGATLNCLRGSGCRVLVGPVETSPPCRLAYPHLACHVQQAGMPWRWVSISHETAGLVGQLALFYEGFVRDEAGRELSDLTLMQWSNRELRRAVRRFLHQSRLDAALTVVLHAKARRELAWVRVSCLLAGLAAVVAVGANRALTEGMLAAGSDSLRWVVPGVAVAAGTGCWGLAVRWWQLRTWLNRLVKTTGR